MASAPSAADVEPVSQLRIAQAVTGIITVLPVLSLIFAGWLLWDRVLGWNDIAVFLIMYLLTGLGVTVGFHRLFTHRAFKCHPAVRATLGILGSAAIEGPIIPWVADHRKHHAFSDRSGDPHSPHLHLEDTWRGALRGLAHAHVGWLFVHTDRARRERYAADLIADPVVQWVNRWFIAWALGGIAVSFGLGWLFGGTVRDGLTGMLWGGAVRMLVLHHVTYSINSLCHFFGRQAFETEDESRNLAWLAPLSLGEAWHNNHHAFPTSAAHGLRRGQFDLSAFVITALESTGLAWDAVRIPPDRQRSKLRGTEGG